MTDDEMAHAAIAAVVHDRWRRGLVRFPSDDDGSEELFIASDILAALEEHGLAVVPRDAAEAGEAVRGLRLHVSGEEACPRCAALHDNAERSFMNGRLVERLLAGADDGR